MIQLVISLALLLLSLPLTFATSLAPIPLDRRVREAEVILKGTVELFEIVDAKGIVVPLEPGFTLSDTQFVRLTIKVSAWIKPPDSELPDKVIVIYPGGKPIYRSTAERDRFANQTAIFLLRGSTKHKKVNLYHPVSVDFAEPIAREAEIKDLIPKTGKSMGVSNTR